MCSESRKAARAVALHDPHPDKHQRKIALEVLGLIASAEVFMPPILEPDPRKAEWSDLEGLDNSPLPATGPKVTPHTEPWDRMSVPEGLRNFDPREPVAPKVRKIPQLDPSKCGSLSGRTQHARRNHELLLAGLPNDPSCDICRPFYTQYQREMRAKRKQAS